VMMETTEWEKIFAIHIIWQRAWIQNVWRNFLGCQWNALPASQATVRGEGAFHLLYSLLSIKRARSWGETTGTGRELDSSSVTLGVSFLFWNLVLGIVPCQEQAGSGVSAHARVLMVFLFFLPVLRWLGAGIMNDFNYLIL
jgi:hypothetical protein